MNKKVMILSGLLLVAIVSGCKTLMPMDPPQPRKEVLCEAWNSEPAANTPEKKETPADRKSKANQAKAARMKKMQKAK